MAFIDLGKLKFNWQGAWNSVTAYETDDVVFHDNQTWVATADIATGQAEPQANTNWSLMAAGFNYRGTYAGGTTYYLHDVVTYGSALYMLTGITETGSQTGVDPGSNPGSDNWEQLTPAPAANVMHTVGDMVIRNNANENARLVVVEEVGKGLTVQEAPLETYSSRAFTYELNGTYGNVINTSGSIPAVTYNIGVKAQRSTNYVIDGSDRDGDINWEYDGTIRVNIGDTVVFDTSAIHPSHPLAIRVSDGGASVSTGTYTGEGTTTVTWVTTGVAAGTYYYQCTSHAGMIGQIIVEDTTNRQGGAGSNGTMQVCRGKTYTITLDNVTSGLSYNLFNAAAPQAGTTNAITTDEGNGTPAGTPYAGSPVTITFTPNETTPDTVYLSSASNTSDQVEITVNDLAYVPSWGTASASSPGAADSREFKYWQDWYGGDTADQTSGTPSDVNHGVILPQNTRDPGDKVKVSGTAVGAQQRRVWRGDSSAFAEFTVPDGVEKVRITALGGGGGGGSYHTHYYGGCGGGGGCFVSGEYSVAEGDVIRVTPGHGGYGDYTSVGGTGGTTTVQDNNSGTLGTKINISAEGGTGGHFGTSIGFGGDTVTLGGTSLLAGNQYKSAGGNGGFGANAGIGWSPESFVSGGGGSSGSAFGPGFNGGSASGSYDGGYWSAGCGGGGIGGNGGSGSTNYTPSTHFPAGGGGGGGSAGPGEHGGICGHNHNGVDYVSVSGRGGRGGAGIADTVHINGYVDIMPEVAGYAGAGESRPQREGDWETLSTSMSQELIVSAGARYGDGEAAHPAAGWNTALHKEQRFIRPLNENNGHTSRLANNTQVFGVKGWNGILGRLWGGGGAGAQTSNASTTGYACSGGEGGSGAGGGGGCTYSNSHGRSVGTMHAKEWSVWDTANMAWRINDAHRVKAAPGLTSGASIGTSIGSGTCGDGGHGGACGGGGAGCWSGRDGGWGGIGAGGGGAANAYSPIHPGTGGQGGVGYVLIEWA